MRNPVLVVGRGDRAKSQLYVEALESLLCPDAHFSAGVERRGSRETFAHRLPGETRTAERCGREYAANRRLGVFATWIDQAQVRSQGRVVVLFDPAEKMPGERVEPVGVLERACLLDDEDRRARREQGIQLGRRQLGETFPFPLDRW